MSGSEPLVEELSRLAELHQNGALSDEEFASAKARVLGTMRKLIALVVLPLALATFGCSGGGNSVPAQVKAMCQTWYHNLFETPPTAQGSDVPAYFVDYMKQDYLAYDKLDRVVLEKIQQVEEQNSCWPLGIPGGKTDSKDRLPLAPTTSPSTTADPCFQYYVDHPDVPYSGPRHLDGTPC